jgi:hypothetical protein
LTTSYQGIKRHKKTKEFYKACLEKMIVWIMPLQIKSLVYLKQKFIFTWIYNVKEFKNELIEYIEWYNNEHSEQKLKRLSPLKYRVQSIM